MNTLKKKDHCLIKLTQEKNVLSKTVAQQDDADGQNDGHEYGGNGQYPVRIHIDAWGNKSRIVPINNKQKKKFTSLIYFHDKGVLWCAYDWGAYHRI